jgi:hypothetical protein
MIARTERRRRWLRLAALAVRFVVGSLALGSGILCGAIAANALGRDSPLVWTVALLVGFGVGLLLMGNATIHRFSNRLDAAASSSEEPGATHTEKPPGRRR